jgi:hypothetical protein
MFLSVVPNLFGVWEKELAVGLGISGSAKTTRYALTRQELLEPFLIGALRT